MPTNLLSKHYYYYTAILYYTMGDEVTVIIRSGFGSKCGGFVKSWKRRWFVLKSNGFLYYYDTANCKNEKGKIDVINSNEVSLWAEGTATDKLPPNASASNSFTLVSGDRTYTCVVDSNEDAREWVQALNKVRSQNKEYPPPTYPKAQPMQAPPQPAVPPHPQTHYATSQPTAGFVPPPMPQPAQPHPYAPQPGLPMPQPAQPRPYFQPGPPMPQPSLPPYGPPMPRPYFQPGPPMPQPAQYPPQYPPQQQQGYYRPPPGPYYPQAPPPRPPQYQHPGPYYQPHSSQQSSVNVTVINI